MDLQQGIPASDLADGAMVAGKVGDDDVLLARRGDEFFAVDAYCTHYHGPLAEGLMVGETVRCPWHHACFDLRTGSAVGAPAMKPVRVYAVVREGEVVRVVRESRVGRPESDRPPDSRLATSGSRHIAIIGAGAAGSFAAAELRRIGFDGKVTLFSAEDRLPYDKPNLSKDYLAGKAQPDWIPLRGEDDYANDHIDLRRGVRVESIDGSELHLADGERVSFDRLILTTGAVPRTLNIPTARGARVRYLRTWADADALIAEAKGNVAIVGAGFIGLETAASLRERGVDVTVIGTDPRPLEKVLGREVADFIRRTHESHGVRFRLGRRPVEIRADSVLLDDGSSVQCDLVVAGIGVEPDVTLAARAGLRIDRGIVVDEFLQTSAPNIFAAGDAARFPYRGDAIRVEHWAVAGRQGQTAARNAIGRRERFAAVPFFWSQHYDLVFAYVGHAQSAADVQLFGSFEETNAIAVYRDGGRIAAVATLFRDDVSLAVEAAMERGAGDEEILAIVTRSSST